LSNNNIEDKRILDLVLNQIDYNGMKVIAEGVKTNEVIEELNIGFILFGEVLRVNKTLAYLNLNITNIGSESCHAIANALKVNDELIELSIETNNITDEGARAIGETLGVNKSLEIIELVITEYKLKERRQLVMLSILM
jgi:Ran GTPase-activating protein (RanGAP) involved in mRNA processing and transport